MAKETWRLGAMMSSRRPLYRGSQVVGHFDCTMSLEMCVAIVAALNFVPVVMTAQIVWPLRTRAKALAEALTAAEVLNG